MELFSIALGITAIYAIVNFVIMSFTKTWADKNEYEKFWSVVAIVFILLLILAVSTQ